MEPPALICADTGGTFTDCLAFTARGVRRAKVLSSGVMPVEIAERHGTRAFRLRSPLEFQAGALRGFRVTPRRTRDAYATETFTSDHESPTSGIVLGHPSPDLVELDRERALAPGDIVDLSTGEPAPVLAARLALGIHAAGSLAGVSFRLATTRGTNALLERKLTPTALFVTRGFRDLLVIGDQRRPDLFALDIRRPAPLYSHVVEVTERLDAQGWEIQRLDLAGLDAELGRLREAGVHAAAIALVHSWRNPAHEEALASHLRLRGFGVVSRSSELSPRIRIVPRARTAVINSALSGAIGGFRDAVKDSAGDAPIRFMTSAGGLVRAEEFEPKDSLLSGPAAGMVGAASAAARSGFARVLTFDMGGTSTDAARWDGEFEYSSTHAVAGAALLAPALAIESVAAGGGSICRVERGAPLVGPASAGAAPGPACYGAGGPLTLTDVNLLLGRLAPDRFQVPIDPAAADRAAEAALPGLEGESRDAMLEGMLAIANQRMADAIRAISVRRGYDPRDYALLAFGGAGPQHACAVADLLGVRSVLIPADASLLSAAGLAEACIERFAERQVLRPLERVEPDLWPLSEELADAARGALAAEGVDAGTPGGEDAGHSVHDITVRRLVSLRYLGQDHAEELELHDESGVGGLARAFEAHALKIFGHVPRGKPVEVESVRVVVRARPGAGPAPTERTGGGMPRRPAPATARVRLAGAWRDVPRLERAALGAAPSDGPALITEERTTTLVEPGWTARADGAGALVLERKPGAAHAGAISPGAPVVSAHPASVREELLIHRLDAVAQEMGETLRRTSLSVNVKERLDFSCAILDDEGRLVVSAPHVPVHLGALGVCVRRVHAALALGPGDVAVTNHPAFGGSHLPDVTLVMPVCDAAGRRAAFLAARAHHAEIGGIRPGSMPPSARTLGEEGVVIPPTLLFEKGRACWDRIETLLKTGPHPSRAVEDNLADLGAALAACRFGADQIAVLNAVEVAGALESTLRRAALAADGAIGAWLGRSDAGGAAAAEEILDDGAVLRVRILRRDRAGGAPGFTLDFSGTSGVHPANLNAPEAVVRSAIAYVVRVLVGRLTPELAENLPLSEGLLDPVEIRVPPGILAPKFSGDPATDPAVAGGNVETSQRLVNLLLRALGLAAGSQGTMNNFLFGGTAKAHAAPGSRRSGPASSYYETICGGCGAGPGFAGASGVHSHMTNTAITDPEVLEFRHPVRLERFELRDDPPAARGGAGAFPGGRGIERDVRFLEARSVSILSQHRARGPAGAGGGADGAPGCNLLLRADGSSRDLGAAAEIEVAPGDRVIIRTPGGGGWGALPGTRPPEPDNL